MKKLLIAAGLLLSMALPANAVLIADLGADPNQSIGRTVNGGAFDDQWTFSLSQQQTITIVAILNTYPQGTSSAAYISGFTGTVFRTLDAILGNADDVAVIGPTLATTPCGIVVNCQSLGGQATLAAGSYYLDFEGTGNGAGASYGGTINTVAVPGPILGAGLPGIIACLGLLGLGRYRRRRAA